MEESTKTKSEKNKIKKDHIEKSEEKVEKKIEKKVNEK